MTSKALVKLIALSEIHRTIKPGVAGNPVLGIAPVKPEIHVIKAGTFFFAEDADQEKEFIGMEAARAADSEDATATPVVDDTTDQDRAIKAEAEKKILEDAAAQKALEDAAAQKALEDAAASNKTTEADAELVAARAEYTEVLGKKPGSMKLDTLKAKIAEKRAADTAAANLV